MNFTDEQLARVWLQCAPMGAWNRLDALRKERGGALNVWRNFTPALYETLGHENFAVLADSRAVRCGPVLRALEARGWREFASGGGLVLLTAEDTEGMP